MVKKHKKTRLTVSLIIGFIAGIEFAILQTFIHFNILPPGGVNAALSMLLTCVVYFIVSGFFVAINSPRKAFWVAICAFIFLCIFAFYSVSLVDFLTFVVLLFGILNSMIILNDKIKTVEGKQGHHA